MCNLIFCTENMYRWAMREQATNWITKIKLQPFYEIKCLKWKLEPLYEIKCLKWTVALTHVYVDLVQHLCNNIAHISIKI